MNIVLTRIDNRLLHGIVMTQWAGTTGAQRVMVIDDKTANSPILKQTMMLAKPAGMAASIITYDTALANMKAGKYEGQKIFLLTKSPVTILKLVKEGIKIPNLQIGATESLEGFKCSRRAFLSEEEVNIVKRGRNYKRDSHPKNTDIITYKKSTGFECLVGYLYLSKNINRLDEIMNIIKEEYVYE